MNEVPSPIIAAGAIAVVAIALASVLSGPSVAPATAEPPAAAAVSDISVVSSTFLGGVGGPNRYVLVLRDAVTTCEYLVVSGTYATAITPRVDAGCQGWPPK